jgi:mannosyltransferase
MLQESLPMNIDLQNRLGLKRYLSPAVLLGLIMLLGITLRFYDLGAEGYWGDEIYSVIEGQQSVHQLLTSGRLDQPPAYYLPFHLWEGIFGSNEVSTRSFSVLAGVGSIILIYLIGRELFGKPIGLLSAFLMAISEFQIIYSQETRYYSFFELMTLLSFLFFILALRSKRKIHFALYGAANVLMLYSHTYGVFILAAQSLFLILHWNKYRNMITSWLICQALVALAFVPYFYILILGDNGISGAVTSNLVGNPVPSLLDPLHTVYRFIMPIRRERSWVIFLANYAGAGALLVAGAWFYAIRQRKYNLNAAARSLLAGLKEVPDGTGKFLLLSCWLVCPILLPFIMAKIIGNGYAERYLISAAPALYLLLASGIYIIRKVIPVIVFLGALVVLLAPGLYEYYVTDVNEQWKEAAAYVKNNSRGDEVTVIAPGNVNGSYMLSFDWYYESTTRSCGLPDTLVDSAAISEALMKCISGHNQFWVIIHGGTQSSHTYESFFINPDQTDLHLLKKQGFVKLSVYLFELKK